MREAIEAAIDEDPTNVGNYSVLADWILEHEPDDPRGEFIMLMLADRPRTEIAQFLLRNVVLDPLPNVAFEQQPLVWRGGFVQRIELRAGADLTTVGLVVQHPSGRWVTEVDI